MDVHLTSEPAEFQARTGEFLAVDPVRTTVFATAVQQVLAGMPPGQRDWWAWITEDAQVVGAAMRTSTEPTRPPGPTSMPAVAATALADALLNRGEDVPAARGFVVPTTVFLQRFADREGGEIRVRQTERLYEVTELRPPRGTTGVLRAAIVDDLDLVTEWLTAFRPEADAQAGRASRPGEVPAAEPERWRRAIESGILSIWEDDGPRCLVGVRHPAGGVARIGPVYTPPWARGRGYAGAAVAQVSRRILAAGHRTVLFADAANPTSVGVYEALRYRAVDDTVYLERVRPVQDSGSQDSWVPDSTARSMSERNRSTTARSASE